MPGLKSDDVPLLHPTLEDWWVVQARSSERAQEIVDAWPRIIPKAEERVIEHGRIEDADRGIGTLHADRCSRVVPFRLRERIDASKYLRTEPISGVPSEVVQPLYSAKGTAPLKSGDAGGNVVSLSDADVPRATEKRRKPRRSSKRRTNIAATRHNGSGRRKASNKSSGD